MTAQGLSSTRQGGRGGVPCSSPWRPPGTPRGAPAPPPPMSCSQRPCEGACTRTVRETQQQGQKVVSGDVGGADVRDRVLAGGARAMANVRSRTAAPPPPPAALPLPPPRRSLRHRAALSRARRVRNAAHPIRRSGCCWRDQREDLGVGPFVRVFIQEAHPLAWSIACGGLRVGRTRRGQHGPWQRAARRRARRHSEQQQLSTWCSGTWWRENWREFLGEIKVPV